MYSGHKDQGFIDRAMDAGAWGYVSKSDPAEEIVHAVHAVRAVAAGKTFLPRNVKTSKGLRRA